MAMLRTPLTVLKDNASRILLRNKECMVAKLFREHPEIDPFDVRLCSRSTADGKIVFWVEARSRRRGILK